LESGDVRLASASSALSASSSARLLIKAQAAWGRDTYRLSLARLATSQRKRAKRDDLPDDQKQYLEKRAGQADELAAWIDALIKAIPAPAKDGTVELRQLVQCARMFVTDIAARASALDTLAAASLGDALGELLALGDFRCSAAQSLRFLRERTETVIVGVDRPRPGHLHVSALHAAAIAGRPCLFVVGLEEGRVFPAPFEDPILLDREREHISPALARSSDRTDESVYAALTRLAAASAQPGVEICLSYSCRDLREYRPTYASWLMLQAYRVTSGNPAAEYKDLREHLGAPKSCVPEAAADALGESRWWLHGVSKAGAPARTDVLRHYPALGAGVAAEAARESPNFTEYDGHVPAAGSVLDPTAGATVSATQLEDAAECPFRHFLKRGLGVDAIESGERDRDVWLDPLLRGSLLHDLYASLLKRSRDDKRRVSVKQDLDWFLEQGRDTLAKLAVEMPPPSVEVRDRESKFFLDDLELFVEGEAALDPSRSPVGFEVSFGRADDVDGEALAQAEPITIDLGGGRSLKLVGRIDRIDQVGPSSFEILDYKTGGYWPDDWKGTFAGGTRLQHALYGLAAVEMLKRKYPKAQVNAAEYYFSSAKGQQERKRIAAQPLAHVTGVLGDLRTVIASGLFVHAHDDRSCKWCHHGYACGKTAPARAKVKLGQDAALLPYAKLANYD
jgi:ATP-dependent helicase/nuclease subunit B